MDGENSSPVIQEEAVNDLLSYLDAHQSMGPKRMHPRLLKDLVEEPDELLSFIYHQSWLGGEVPDDWKLVDVLPTYKKGKRRIQELQACQPELSAQQGYGIDHFECDHMAPTGS
ncbi:hypothetical protein TURU_023604 [Turdus rufiventris]|nr:hypothetical protein TURU_023604 [Turdus rufiventris]